MSSTGDAGTAARSAAGAATVRPHSTGGAGLGMSGNGSGGTAAGASSTAASGPAGSDVDAGATVPTRRQAAGSVNRGRRVKLTVSRVDPWSAMKMSFLLSVALGIAMVVMVAVLWTILAGMGVFDQVDSIIKQVLSGSDTKAFSIKDFVGFGRVVSLSIVIAVLDVIIMTAIATLGAFLYNVCSALVGGLQLTLTDD